MHYNMTKFLLVICVFTSTSFLLTQFIALHYFNDNAYSGDNKLLTSIKLLQHACEETKVNCILADIKLLEIFIENELTHRHSGNHDHETCKIFCDVSSTTFMIEGINIVQNFSPFEKLLKSKGFTISIQEDYDKREESLEHKHGKYKLKYHLFLERDRTFIHLVVIYQRFNHEWSNKCDPSKLQNINYISYAENSIFCNRENILKPFQIVTAVIDGVNLDVPAKLVSFIGEMSESTFIPCNYEQARSFYSKYGYDSTYESEMFRSKANHILTIVVDVLSKLNVRFWLSSGTCLGWYRQCDFLPHGKDVDIGIYIKDYKGEIISAFSEQGLTLKHLFGKIKDSYELSFTIDDLKLDIFFFYENVTHMWNGGTQARTGKKFKYVFSKFELCWTTISDLLVRVPCDTNKYILANYGEKWNTLVKTWDWKASPPNVQENGEWPVHERNKVIQMF